MVRAILAGTKTQTRRAVKPQPALVDPRNSSLPGLYRNGDFAWRDKGAPLGCATISCKPNGPDGWALENSPFGQPGDRLWVRETWAAPHSEDARPPRAIQCDWMRIHYAATEERGGLLWRPSIHMPRWASRITLEITGVRVERLQDISEADAQAEGCSLECMTPTGDDSGSAIYGPGGYLALWESINGAGSWDVNPWVWVIEFRRMKGEAA